MIYYNPNYFHKKSFKTTMTSTLKDLYNKTWYEAKSKSDKRPLSESIAHMGNDKFIVGYELTKKSRTFATFENLEEFLNAYEDLPEEHPKTYYEVIHDKHHMYFDLDFRLSDFKLKTMINSFVNLLQSVYLDNFEELFDNEIFILDASDKVKGSLHFILRFHNLLLRNSTEACKLAQLVYDARNPEEFDYVDENGNKASAIDLNLYKKNQQLRIIHAHKYGSDRVLKPISIKGNHLKKYDIKKYFASYCEGDDKYYYDDEDIEPTQEMKAISGDKPDRKDCKLNYLSPLNLSGFLQKAIKLFSECDDSTNHNLSSYTVEEHKDGNLEISFKRLSSSHCELCDKTHDKDNTAFLLVCVDDNKVFLKCYKPYNQGKSTFIGNLTAEIPETTENMCETNNTNDTGFTRQAGENQNNSIDENEISFIQKAIITATEKTQAILEAKIEKQFKKTGAKVIRYNNKYCSNNEAILNSEATIIGQRASMGTGKTNAVAKRAMLHYNSKEKRYVVLSFRISLSDQLKNDKFSADPNIVCYKDCKGTITAPHLIIQPESLHRYGLVKADREYLIDEIFIDEATQVKRQFTSDTFLKNPNANRSYKMFQHIIKNAKHIHLMDANLNADVIKWIQDIRGSKTEPIEIFWNEHKNLAGRDIKITASEIDILRLAQEDLNSNKRVFIASNSKVDKIRAYGDLLTTEGKKTLCINAETLNDENVKKALANPNDPTFGWGKYDLVICSPSIQSGISYDKPETFDTVYGIFGNYSSAPQDCGQMLNRVRHPKNNITTVSINMGNNNIGAITEAGIINHIKYNRDHTNKAISERIQAMENVVDYDISNYGFTEFKKTDIFKLIVQNQAEHNKDLKYFIWSFIRNHHIEGYNISEFDTLAHFGITHDANLDIMKEYRKLIKTIRGKNKFTDATFISEAKNKTEEEIKAIVAKLNTNTEIKKEDKDALLKHNITEQYGVERQQSPLWFEAYGDDKTRTIYNNQNRILKHETFSDALEELKKCEMLSAKKSVDNILNPDLNIEFEDALAKGAINYAKTKPKYGKYKLLVEWIEKLGYKSIDPMIDASIISSDDINDKLKNIHRSITRKPEHVIKTLDKDKRKMDVIAKWKYKDDKFQKNMLDFINGSLRKELGVSIGMMGKHDNRYILKNNYLDVKAYPHFNNVNRPEIKQDLNVWTPSIGNKTQNIVEMLPRNGDGPYDSDDENEE